MDFLHYPWVQFSGFVVLMLFSKSFLSDYPKHGKYCLLLALASFMIGSMGGLWYLTNQLFLVSILINFTFYICFCHSLRKRVQIVPYTIFFVFVTLFFIIWITVIFGKYYFDNELVEILDYKLQYNAILELHDFFLAANLKLSIMFFNIGFEKYFSFPTDISFSNPFFIQFIAGIVISGTIISWGFDMFKQLIVPSNISE